MRLPVQLVEGFDDCQLNFEVLQTPPWSAPVLINSWANFGSGFETAGYLKDGLGFVHLKGTLHTGTSGTVMFVLPPGYRPGAKGQYPSVGLGGTAGYVQIDTVGNITGYDGSPAVVGLSGISFLGEN